MRDALAEVAENLNLFRHALDTNTVRVLSILVMWQHGDEIREIEKRELEPGAVNMTNLESK